MIYIDATTGITVFVTTAATADLDTAQLEALQRRYDGPAASDTDRDAVLSAAFDLVGGAITSMVLHAAKGRLHDADMARNYAMQALHAGLENSGKAAFTAKSGVWDYAIEDCLRGRSQAASAIWERLSPELKRAIQARPQYVARPEVEKFVAQLNSMLRDRQFVEMAASMAPLPTEAKDMAASVHTLPMSSLTALGAKAVQAIFPEAAIKVPEIKSNLLGYVKTYVLPRMMQQVWQEAGSKLSRYDLEVYNLLKPYVAELDELTATAKVPDEIASQPRYQQVYFLYRRGLDRMQSSLRWFETAVKKYQPENPFRVNSPESLRDARQLLLEHGVSDMPKVTTKSLKPISLQKATAVLELAEGQPQAPRPVPTVTTQPGRGDEEAMKWLQGGHASKAYRHLVEKMFPKGEAENMIGNFLARNPTPSRTQVSDWIDSLPEQVAEEIENAGGFDRVSLDVDRQVFEAVRSPEMRRELQQALGSSQSVTAAIDSIHRSIAARRTGFFARLLKSA